MCGVMVGEYTEKKEIGDFIERQIVKHSREKRIFVETI